MVTINLAPDLLYKGIEHPVGAGALRVYQASANDHDFELPVWREEAVEGTVDTGERVQVWLRSDYRDPHLLTKPNLTLLVIGFFVLLYLFVSILTRVTAVWQRPRR